MTRKTILLVEDNPRDLELTLFALEKTLLSNEVVVVRDGEEALDFMFRQGEYAEVSSSHPVVVLLDLKLPKIDGLEVLARLKRDKATSNVPVVMLTASREESDMIRSYNLGVNAYVVKPIGFKEFVTAIQQLSSFWASLNETPPESVKTEEHCADFDSASRG